MESFLTLYAAPDELLSDSDDLRHRLAKCIYRFSNNWNIVPNVVVDLDDELAIVIESSGRYGHYWPSTFSKLPLKKVLSTPTIVHAAILVKEKSTRVPTTGFYSVDFIANINRIFVEESAAYYVDKECIVHPKPDEAYRATYVQTIKGLSGDNCEAARNHVAKSDASVLQDPPDWELAIY